MLRWVRICAARIAICCAATAAAQDFDAIKRVAKEGDANAQFTLGTMYAEGQGTDQDYTEAAQLVGMAIQGYFGITKSKSIKKS